VLSDAHGVAVRTAQLQESALQHAAAAERAVADRDRVAQKLGDAQGALQQLQREAETNREAKRRLLELKEQSALQLAQLEADAKESHVLVQMLRVTNRDLREKLDDARRAGDTADAAALAAAMESADATDAANVAAAAKQAREAAAALSEADLSSVLLGDAKAKAAEATAAALDANTAAESAQTAAVDARAEAAAAKAEIAGAQARAADAKAEVLRLVERLRISESAATRAEASLAEADADANAKAVETATATGEAEALRARLAAQLEASNARCALLERTLQSELEALDAHSTPVESDLVTLRGLGGGADAADAPGRRSDFTAVEAWMRTAMSPAVADGVWASPKGEAPTPRQLLNALALPELRARRR
jgi:hypothetical protein